MNSVAVAGVKEDVLAMTIAETASEKVASDLKRAHREAHSSSP